MIEQLVILFEENKNEENAAKQKAYLKNQFEFLGIAKPIRAKLEKEFVKSTKEYSVEELKEIIFELANLGYREYLYTAQQVMNANFKRFSFDDVIELVEITKIGSWWENTDGFQSFLKKWFKVNLKYIRPFVEMYYKDDNMWMRRLAIIAQLGIKEDTDFVILKKAIRFNNKYDQFFIQKAIGWSLRDYSKVNPNAVNGFLDSTKSKMSNLAIREASKYL